MKPCLFARTRVIAATAFAALVLHAPALAAPGDPMHRMDPQAQSANLGAVDPATHTASLPDDRECPRIRRKLWVEGEGWIVRRVAICR